jgi:hypothetical protein
LIGKKTAGPPAKPKNSQKGPNKLHETNYFPDMAIDHNPIPDSAQQLHHIYNYSQTEERKRRYSENARRSCISSQFIPGKLMEGGFESY